MNFRLIDMYFFKCEILGFLSPLIAVYCHLMIGMNIIRDNMKFNRSPNSVFYLFFFFKVFILNITLLHIPLQKQNSEELCHNHILQHAMRCVEQEKRRLI